MRKKIKTLMKKMKKKLFLN